MRVIRTDVDADEGDLSADGLGVLAVNDTSDSHNKLTDNHAQRTPE